MITEPSYRVVDAKLDHYQGRHDFSEIKGKSYHFCYGNQFEVYKFILHVESLLSHGSYRIRTYCSPKWHYDVPGVRSRTCGVFGWKVTVKASKEEVNLIRLTI